MHHRMLPSKTRWPSLNLSRRDLNASCSGCLPEFFLGVFKFQCMLLGKKSYLLDFSFKFNAIKFGNLLMNWFVREKMFTYCYNKFGPLNRMHCVKCSVNSMDKKNQLDVTFCILYFSSNSCSTCFGQPCAHHQELTTA